MSNSQVPTRRLIPNEMAIITAPYIVLHNHQYISIKINVAAVWRYLSKSVLQLFM